MTQETPILNPAKPLTEEQLKPRIEALGVALKAAGCSDLSKLVAEHIVDVREGGRMKNIITAMPNLAPKPDETPVGQFTPAADRNKDSQIDTVEGMALLMAGVDRAVKANAPDLLAYVKAIQPDEQFFKEVDDMCKQIQATSCSLPIPKESEKPKPTGRGK